MKNIVFIIDGGIGKNIVATVPLRELKKANPDKNIIVVSGYPEVFQNNPNCARAYHFQSANFFYDDYVVKEKSQIIKQEPYLETSYLYGEKHLASAWCDMLGLPCESVKPDIYLSDNEKQEALGFIATRKKPLIALQTHGGTPKAKMYKRNIPIDVARGVVAVLKDKYDVLHFRYKDQPNIPGTEPTMFQLREVFALLPHFKKILCIDSFMQHACAALDIKSIVCWGGTSPRLLGYESNINLTNEVCKTPFCHRPNSFALDTCNGKPWECSENEICMNHKLETIEKEMLS